MLRPANEVDGGPCWEKREKIVGGDQTKYASRMGYRHPRRDFDTSGAWGRSQACSTIIGASEHKQLNVYEWRSGAGPDLGPVEPWS